MLQIVVSVIGIITTVLLAYQIVYALVGLFTRPRRFENGGDHRFAVLISARNEESVIAGLLESLKNQTYPSDKVDLYVVADNCTDRTADIARSLGAIVLERFDTTHIGKGYALNFLLDHIRTEKGEDCYDGFLVFDADNVVEPNYIEEINKTFSNGYRIVTSYRNSKNFGANWITSGYGIWFLREARSLNHPRMLMGSSCAVSGTGFLFHRDILKMHGGWNFFLLTEDIQFSVASILKGEKIGYCHDAVFYDEQPTNFGQSWKQRLRWARGILQVCGRYSGRLLGGIFKNKHKNRFAHFDLFVTVLPLAATTLFTVLCILTNAIEAAVRYGTEAFWGQMMSAIISLLSAYGMFMLMAIVVLITEWRMIRCSTPRKLLSVFTFPLFMLLWIVVGIIVLFRKVQWVPIQHNVNMSVDEIKNDAPKSE